MLARDKHSSLLRSSHIYEENKNNVLLECLPLSVIYPTPPPVIYYLQARLEPTHDSTQRAPSLAHKH